MNKKIRISIIAVLIILIFALIGFPNSNKQVAIEKNSNTFTYTQTFPWDLNLLGKATLKCTNEGREPTERC